MGRVTEHDGVQGLLGSVTPGTPTTPRCRTTPSTVDPLVVDVAADAVIDALHRWADVVKQFLVRLAAVPANGEPQLGPGSRAGLIEIVIDVDTGLLADAASTAPMTAGLWLTDL